MSLSFVRTGASLLALMLCAAAAAAPASPAASGQGDWTLNGRDSGGTYFSPLTAINRDTVGKLGFAWEFRDFVVRGETHRGVEATPILVDGVLYFTGPWGVTYAVDARTGKSIWTYDPHPDGSAARASCCDAVNRGVAVSEGKVFSASLDGYLTALDAKTGKPVWRADTFVDRTMDYTITGAPAIAGDKILIGNAGADMGTRGYVSAYDRATGKLAWRFWATPGDPAKGPDETPDVTFARKSWNPKARWDLGGGGAPWNAIAYDPELNIAYLGFGNGGPFPSWIRSPGTGDTLFTCSIVAVDATTGRMKWYYQETPRDSWDYDATSPMVLVDLPWNGTTRKLLMQTPKNGIFYVLDRVTGELLKADPYTAISWTDGVDLKTGRPHMLPASTIYDKGSKIVWPGAPGGHSWQPISFDRKTGLVYFSASIAPMKYLVAPEVAPVRGAMFDEQGAEGEFPPFTDPEDLKQLKGAPPAKFETRLKAWDPAKGKEVWHSDPLPFVSGGVLTTAGGLVFEGATDGGLTIYDDATGRVLKRIETGTSLMAAPITYALDGVQYVAILAGAGGPQGVAWSPDVAAAHYRNFERLLVFKLDGGPVPLPPKAEPPAMQPTPAPIPTTAAVLARGHELFEANCQRCHLMGGAFGEYPNLWNLPPEALDMFDSIVHDGALADAGMAAFSDHLSANDVTAIKSFIVNDEIEKRRAGTAAGAHSRATSH